MRLLNYLRDTKNEMRHVNWPTKNQAFAFTIIVVVVAILTGVYLGFFDFVFTKVLQDFIL